MSEIAKRILAYSHSVCELLGEIACEMRRRHPDQKDWSDAVGPGEKDFSLLLTYSDLVRTMAWMALYIDHFVEPEHRDTVRGDFEHLQQRFHEHRMLSHMLDEIIKKLAAPRP